MSREVRKTVTVLFSDVAGSTALGEQLDPEALRMLMVRYFTEMRAAIERHGGSVEKFIGDAVMAVFGVPRSHEDDALRAVRAAMDIRLVLAQLNAASQSDRGIQVVFRTGINTGEVVAGDVGEGHTLVTGDTVNTAARLEQAAAPGEILLGEPTYRLVRDAVSVEPAEAFIAKGKADPVLAYRLLGITGTEGHLRRADAALLGREREMAQLGAAYQAAVGEQAPHLVTVVGAAGVGKSRLIAEFISSVEADATVLKGRCLPYGEGITYWPLREVVHTAAGIRDDDTGDEARAKLEALVRDERDGELIAARLGSATGLSSDAAPQEEIFWASRRLLECIAGSGPTVALFEDIHWAEPTFLDLVEYLAEVTADVPLLLLCPARPELDASRPGWGSGIANARTLRLEGLGDDTTSELVDTLPGGTALPQSLRSLIVERAEGNPLFVEEMLGMLVDERLVEQRDGRWAASPQLADVPVPASIGVLLAARIDTLPADERVLAERASVVGRSFEAAAVRELAGEGTDGVTRGLRALVRKAFLRPDRAELTAGDAFKFRHILIRDAAYQALAKVDRAELHERYADWLEQVAGERLAELEEVLGYHLEQAARYLAELGRMGERLDTLADRAAVWLARAGHAARAREDVGAAESLLRRASELARTPATLIETLGELGAVLLLRDQPQESLATLDRAVALGDGEHPVLAARAMIDRWTAKAMLEQPVAGDAYDAEFEQVVRVLTEADDHVGLARAWRHHSAALEYSGERVGAAAATRQALEHAEQASDQGEYQQILYDLLIVAGNESTPVREAMDLADRLLAMPAIRRTIHASILAQLARLEAMRGREDVARELGARSLAEATELGDRAALIEAALNNALLELELDHNDRALPFFRRAYDLAAVDLSYRPYVAARLAQAHAYAGDLDEARRYATEVDETLTWDEPGARGAVEAARGLELLAQGDVEGAERRLREAVAYQRLDGAAQQTARFLLDLARVLQLSGQHAAAIECATEALTMYEQKGNVPGAARARWFLRLSDAAEEVLT